MLVFRNSPFIEQHLKADVQFHGILTILMRLILTTIILTILAQTVWADTTNRAKQFSPVPGIFVGGVGLECRAEAGDDVRFVLLTKDRKKFGIVSFETGDVVYDFLAISEITLRRYIAHQPNGEEQKLVLDRRSLKMSLDQDYQCTSMSIDDLHQNAESHLRALLSENKI